MTISLSHTHNLSDSFIRTTANHKLRETPYVETDHHVKFWLKSSPRASWQLPLRVELDVWISIAAELFMINDQVVKCQDVHQRIIELSCTQTNRRRQPDNVFYRSRSIGYANRLASNCVTCYAIVQHK